jgi:predicted transcriptional regulator of viral defense system
MNIRFGGLETRLLFALEEGEAGLVSSGDIAGLLGVSKGRANKLAWQLAGKNRLIRIRKGVYLFAPMKAGERGFWSEESLALVSQLFKDRPYYVSFWAALNFYGFTEQIPWVVQVVVPRRVRSFEAVGSRFVFVTVKRLGEWREEIVAGKAVKVATVEQLIIDCLSHPDYCGGMREVSKALWESRKRIEWGKLEKLAAGSSEAARRRLGFLMESLSLPSLNINVGSGGWRWLDPSAKKLVVDKSKKWGLLVNLTREELTDWMGT